MTREEVKVALNCDLADYKLRLELWKGVTRKYKKDGGSFAVLSKNFEGCRIYRPDHAFYSYQWEASVHGRLESGKYINDNIYAYNNDEMRMDTADELQLKIDEQIVRYEKRIDELEDALAKLDSALDKCDELLKEYKSVVQSDKWRAVKYELREYMEKNLSRIY